MIMPHFPFVYLTSLSLWFIFAKRLSTGRLRDQPTRLLRYIDTELLNPKNMLPLKPTYSRDCVAMSVYIFHFLAYLVYPALVYIETRDFNNFDITGSALGIGLLSFNLLQVLAPTRPPWKFLPSCPPCGRRLAKFPLARRIWTSEGFTDGAFPSFHAGLPIVLLSCLRAQSVTQSHATAYTECFAVVHAAVVGWAAVYTDHHWTMDVGAGWAVGAAVGSAYGMVRRTDG